MLRYVGDPIAYWDWPPEKAIGYVLRGQQLDPLNPVGNHELAFAYYNADQFEQSLQALDRTLELNPSFWVAWWRRPWPLFELGRYAEAVESARRALELSGGYVDINADLIVMLAAAGRQAEAEGLSKNGGTRSTSSVATCNARHCARGPWSSRGSARGHRGSIQSKRRNIMDLLDHRLFVPLHDEQRFMRIVKELEKERRVERLKLRLGAT